MSTIRATITTAAIATMATVDAARITRPSFPAACLRKPRRERGLEQIRRQLQCDARGGGARPWPTRLADARVRGQLFEPVSAPCVTAEEAKNRAQAITHATTSATRLIRRLDVHVIRIRSHSTTRISRAALPSQAAFAASRRRSRRRATLRQPFLRGATIGQRGSSGSGERTLAQASVCRAGCVRGLRLASRRDL
jgi:hypothetical protein